MTDGVTDGLTGGATSSLDGRLEAWSSLVAVYQSVLHDIVYALEHDAGLDSGVYSALAYLDRAEEPGQMPMSELTRLMHPRYSQPGMSRLVQRMEFDGLVARQDDPTDGRAVVLTMTRSGRARFQRAHDVYVAALDRHFARFLTPGESTDLTGALQQLLQRRAGRPLG